LETAQQLVAEQLGAHLGGGELAGRQEHPGERQAPLLGGQEGGDVLVAAHQHGVFRAGGVDQPELLAVVLEDLLAFEIGPAGGEDVVRPGEEVRRVFDQPAVALLVPQADEFEADGARRTGEDGVGHQGHPVAPADEGLAEDQEGEHVAMGAMGRQQDVGQGRTSRRLPRRLSVFQAAQAGLERRRSQARDEGQGGAARLLREPFVAIAIGQHPGQGPAPGGGVLRRQDRHGFLEGARPAVLGDRRHRQDVVNSQLGLRQSPEVAGEHRDAAQHGLDGDHPEGLAPERRRQQDPGAGQDVVDLLARLAQGDVGQRRQGRALRRPGAPGGHGGEGDRREGGGQVEEDGQPLEAGGVDQGHRTTVEAAETGERGLAVDREADHGRLEAPPASDVAADVLADREDPRHPAEERGPGRVLVEGLGPEGQGRLGVGDVDDPARGELQRRPQEEAGVVLRDQHPVGRQVPDLPGQVGVEAPVVGERELGGHGVDLDPPQAVDDEVPVLRDGRHGRGREVRQQALALVGAGLHRLVAGREDLALVTAGGERLHQPAVGLVGAAEREAVVEQLDEEELHGVRPPRAGSRPRRPTGFRAGGARPPGRRRRWPRTAPPPPPRPAPPGSARRRRP
jgi:hypothetical protein